MKRIYEIASKKGVEIPSHRHGRINSMPYTLSDRTLNKMTKHDFEKYLEACWCCGSEHAGGYDGWSHGHDLLKELGFVEVERRVGHRIFVKMLFKGQTDAHQKDS